MTITIEQLVQREVGHCVSYLVSTLAGGYGYRINENADNLRSLLDQAMELSLPIDDYEEAATGAGWTQADDGRWFKPDALLGDECKEWAESAEDVCIDHEGIEPYRWEVFEHWIVSDWLADKLMAHGEKVDKDFAGLCVWARTTTGQAIAMDAVMVKIHAELAASAASNDDRSASDA